MNDQPAKPLEPKASAPSFGVYNKTLLRFEGTSHATREDAQAAAKELRDGKRKGHKLEVQEVQ